MRMLSPADRVCRLFVIAAACAVVFAGAIEASGQSDGLERNFPQSKDAIESAVKQMSSTTSGRLPVLDGFATSPDQSLENYRRGYYQAKFRVSALPSGGSLVYVTVEVTAWFADPNSSSSASGRSGYQLLKSNGRLEADMLDQLSDQLAQLGPGANSPATVSRQTFPAERTLPAAKPGATNEAKTLPPSVVPEKASNAAGSAISAPVPQIPGSNAGLNSTLAQGLSQQTETASEPEKKTRVDYDHSLRAEVESLEEILKNQAHPKNLVAVKKSGTPVADSASLNAKTLFLASAHDEFEMLDYNQDWVHVRISGLSRGWIWRNGVEMPDSVPDSDAAPDRMPAAADVFHVTREETAQFPGDWAPLRGKNVKIVSVEKTNESKEVGPQLRLEFVKSLFDQNFAALTQKTEELAGIVVIFDSADGGMIAAPLTVLQQWKAGTLSDAAMWHQCFFDPPETFNASTVSPAGSQSQ